ncbi:unnamed protein product, partial [Hapterophycus canaliculatus]
MDSAPPRSVLRDRSNNDGNITKSLICGLIDHSAGGQQKPTLVTLSPPASAAGNVDGNAIWSDVDIGKAVTAPAVRPAAAPATPTVRTVTPESSQPGADPSTTSYVGVPAYSLRTTTVGVRQQQQEEQRHLGDTCTATEGAAPAATSAAETPLDHNRHHHSSQRASSFGTRQPPPPVACTLVAFEPGSLGLELEAIVDEDARGAEETRDGQGEQQHRLRRRRRRPRRLGCRVFRVTPEGQAARHGSVHPGDALVVLDGVDVLSDTFEDITRTLLQRQGRRRLIGFMGAAAVGAAHSTGAASAPAPRVHRRQPPPPPPPPRASCLSSEPSEAVPWPPAGSETAASATLNCGDAAGRVSAWSGARPAGAPAAATAAAAAAAAAVALDSDGQQHQRRNERGRRRERTEDVGGAGRQAWAGAATPRVLAEEASQRGGESAGVSDDGVRTASNGGPAATSSRKNHEEEGMARGKQERGRKKGGAPSAAGAAPRDHLCRGHSPPLTSTTRVSYGAAVGLEERPRAAATAERLSPPSPIRDTAATRSKQRPVDPAGGTGTIEPRHLEGKHKHLPRGAFDRPALSAITEAAARTAGDGRYGGGTPGPTEARESKRERRSGSWTGGDNVGGSGGGGGGGGGGSAGFAGELLGSSWGSSATTGHVATATAAEESSASRGRRYRARPLDGSRG